MDVKLTFSVINFPLMGVKVKRLWAFYDRCSDHSSFLVRYVGKLVGRYYDGQGNPTKYLKGVEAKAARGAQLLEKQKNEEAKLLTCNSRWSQQEGGEVSAFMTNLIYWTLV